MTKRTRLSTIGLVVLLLAIGVLIVSGLDKKTPVPQGNTYTSSAYGFSFSYPDKYVLREEYRRDESIPHHAITLIEEASLPIPAYSEGPMAITFNTYTNSDNTDPVDWIKENKESNFGLGDEKVYPITVDGEPAYVYNWDGLYRGKSIVFQSGTNVVIASVAYNADTDKIRNDFEEIISSIKLEM